MRQARLGAVYVVHGTRKFLERVGDPSRAEIGDSTTVLSHWYATVLFWKPQAGLFVNEATLLPVLLPLAPAAAIVGRFPAALATVLRRHGIGEAFIAAECEAMNDHRLAKTKDRSVVGMMTEFAFLSRAYAKSEDAVTSSNCRCGWPAPRADRWTAAKAAPTESWLPIAPGDAADCGTRFRSRDGVGDERDRVWSYDLGTRQRPRRAHG